MYVDKSLEKLDGMVHIHFQEMFKNFLNDKADRSVLWLKK